MEYNIFLITLSLVFSLGVISTLLVISITNLKNKYILLKQKEVLWTRFNYWINILLVLFAVWFIAGPGGWIYADFQHYQSKVVCIPNNWEADFYPAGRYYPYKIEYKNNKTTTLTDKNLTKLNLTELNFSHWQEPNQQVPFNPEEFDGLYKTIGGANE